MLNSVTVPGDFHIQLDTVVQWIINLRFELSRGGMMDPGSFDLSNILAMGLRSAILRYEQPWQDMRKLTKWRQIVIIH